LKRRGLRVQGGVEAWARERRVVEAVFEVGDEEESECLGCRRRGEGWAWKVVRAWRERAENMVGGVEL
jgi:hypothetical protein